MSFRFIKHNRFSRAILESALRYRCRSTKAFVFAANPGRSGSKTLSDMLAGIPGIAAFHEPTPNMTFEPALGHDQSDHHRRLFCEKKIYYVLQAAAGNSHYVESNHLFIKTFIALAAEYFGERLKVVHLRRDPVSVALSFHRLGDIPGLGPVARRYMLDPAAPGQLIDPRLILTPGAGFDHPLYRCLWYWYEIEARIARAKRQFPGVGWHFLRTDDLNEPSAIRSLCDALAIESGADEIVRRAGLKSNLRTTHKEIASSTVAPLSRDEAVAMHERLVSAMGLDRSLAS